MQADVNQYYIQYYIMFVLYTPITASSSEYRSEGSLADEKGYEGNDDTSPQQSKPQTSTGVYIYMASM